MSKSMKRIHKVEIQHIPDTTMESDEIGTYDNEPKSEYAIKLDEPCRGYRFEGYPYYNGPVDNYQGIDPEEIRKYVQQDFERMQAYNAGYWNYIGIRAVADVQVSEHGPIQRIESGGLWGIESDAGEYLKEIDDEQLSELRNQLHAIGFSNRAISAGMRDLRREASMSRMRKSGSTRIVSAYSLPNWQ